MVDEVRCLLAFRGVELALTEILLRSGAIALLIIGITYPLIAMVDLVRRMNRPGLPPLSTREIMVRLFLIASVPLAGILGGFAGLLPAVWASFVLRSLIIATAAGSLIGFVVLLVTAHLDRKIAAHQATDDDTRTEAKGP
jgi:hypothetical protein